MIDPFLARDYKLDKGIHRSCEMKPLTLNTGNIMLSDARRTQKVNEDNWVMKCPKCNNTLEESVLYANRYACLEPACNVKWVELEWGLRD